MDPLQNHALQGAAVAAGLGSGSADAAQPYGVSPSCGASIQPQSTSRRLGLVWALIFLPVWSAIRSMWRCGEILQPGPKLPKAGIVLVTLRHIGNASVFQARRGGFSPEMPMMKPPRSFSDFVQELGP